ncbi:hypothetical protein Tco_0882092, partial [Tanacetum coccineum]
VEGHANEEGIKLGYGRLAKYYHPDVSSIFRPHSRLPQCAGKQTWWYRVESNTLTREDAELRFFERLLQESNLGGIESQRAIERRNTTDISQAIRPLTGCKKSVVVKDGQELFMTLFKYEELSIVWRLMERILNTLDQIQAYILLAGPVGKGQPHIVHVKLEQGGLAAPLLARDTKTELGDLPTIGHINLGGPSPSLGIMMQRGRRRSLLSVRTRSHRDAKGLCIVLLFMKFMLSVVVAVYYQRTHRKSGISTNKENRGSHKALSLLGEGLGKTSLTGVPISNDFQALKKCGKLSRLLEMNKQVELGSHQIHVTN